MNRISRLDATGELRRRVEATLEDRIDAAAVRAFRDSPSETYPDSVVAAILDGAHPVKAMREHRGYTQRELAVAASTSPIYLSQIERGKRHAGRKLLAKHGKALAVDPEVLGTSEA